MVAQSIDQLKQEWTDKYVVVDGERPELARFRDVVGGVKTVNMSGRALVEFDDYHLNIGWYDIDLEFLKVVDKPPPKARNRRRKRSPPQRRPPAKPLQRPGPSRNRPRSQRPAENRPSPTSWPPPARGKARREDGSGAAKAAAPPKQSRRQTRGSPKSIARR